MRIICPEHQGLIEVPDKDIALAFSSPAKALIFNCAICDEEVLIHNVNMDIKSTNTTEKRKSERG